MPQTPQNVTSLDQNEDEDDDEVIGFRKRLRKRTSVLLPDSEDEDIENSRQLVPGPSTRRQSAKKAKIQEPEDEGGSSWPSIDDEMDLDDFVIPDEEPPSTPKKPKPVKPRTPSSRLVTPQKPPPSASKLQAFSMTPNSAKKATTPRTPFGDDKKKTRNETFKQKNEERYAWLLDPKDEDGRSPTEEGYDPRTLLIPKNAWNRFTPFEKQFWEIKSQHWDTVIFFKKGKFYELYEKDADIGHQHFDLKLTDRVNMRMVGVPESSFDHWAAQFLAKGYRVGKVDQMENAVGKAMRDREKTSKSQDDKIIRRELKRVLTVGTLVDAGLLTDDMGTYTMAIVEELEADHLPPKYGVAFVDTATSEFSLCCFDDDVERTRLETLIMQVKPAEVILKKGSSSKALLRLLKNNLRDLQTTQLAPEREFWTAEMLIDELRMGRFIEAERESWPAALQEAQAITLEAMGGLVYYLRYLKIEQDLLSAKNFHTYDPIRQVGSLILDGQTLINLEIFENTSDGTDKGTLHKLLNHCETPFGKRLFKKWLCHPLRNKAEINDRLNALEDFTNIAGQREKVQSTLRKLPDLERIISRIHAGAVRVKEFCDTLSSFEAIGELLEEMNPFIEEFTSLRLKRIFTAGLPTELQESLQYFREAFDRPTALSNDTIELHSGYDAEFDKALQEVERLEQALETHRLECQKSLKCKVTFKDMGKELFQMEVPKSTKVPRNWQIKSNTASVSRYWNDRVEDYVKEYREAQERKDEALRNIKSFLCKKFDEHYVQWLAVVKSVAELDCMISLAKCKEAIGEPSCRPEFVDSGESLLEIDEMRHPCINHGITQEFIPNDLHFGGDAKPNMVLLTGPNMGGKSTLLRQTCISVIMAQLGCYVPARSCRMTIFDRIFTRLGANDNILAGQSTFMVELAETCKIMREATPRSFVILDELGRGTSTFDGYAIAYAVLHHLITHVRCLGLFSTHYRMLTNEFDHNALVTMKYMSFLTDEEKGEVTFLYKLAEGSCPKSYGMNVAKIAGILDEIVEKADRIAAAFQHRKESFSDSNAQ
ncbi:muts domain V-domain-containing protein [Phlyctochytrium arcticum]|nr:muts domain V-domain-containing protein [Phlyctochytrium arcticum]